MSKGNDGLISRVAQEEALKGAFASAAEGQAKLVLIEGAEGSGRRALLSNLLEREIPEAMGGEKPILPIRAHYSEGEDGLRVLLRLYAGLYRGIQGDEALKARIHSSVDEQLATIEAEAVEGEGQKPMALWLKAFKEGLDKETPNTDATTFQVTVPRASPYLGLGRILDLLAKEAFLVVEIADAQHILSYTFWTFFTSLMGRASRSGSPHLFVVGYTPRPEKKEGGKGQLRTMLDRFLETTPEGSVSLKTPPLTSEELGTLISNHYKGLALPDGVQGALMAISKGLPGQALGILERLKEQKRLQLNGDDNWKLDLGQATFDPQSLLPPLPDGDEARLRRALQIAALEGRTFTASVVANALELKQDEVDDLLDELDDHIDEVVFHEGLKSWLYRFKSPLFQRQILAELSDTARQSQARQLGTLLEQRYVMRAPEFATKAARLWLEVGEEARCARLLGVAAAMERGDVLQMGFEILITDDETKFNPSVTRGLLLTLLEKLASGGNPRVGEQVAERMAQFIEAEGATELEPLLSQYNARLAQRQGKSEEAIKLAKSARKGFAKAKNTFKETECLALLGTIELGRGQGGPAMEYAQRAMKAIESSPKEMQGAFAPIRAQAQFTRGLVFKSRGELQEAVNSLRETLDLSARLGMMVLHADAGLNLSETLLMGNNGAGALGLLEQLGKFTKQYKMAARERGVLSLTAKAHAGLKDYTQAINFASQALQLARAQKNKLGEAADLFDLGLFSYQKGQLDEAQIYLKEAEHTAKEAKHGGLMAEITFHQGLVASALKDLDKAEASYLEAEGYCKAIGNERRLTNIVFNLGAIYLHKGDQEKARNYLGQAGPLVEKYGTEADKKGMTKAKRKLESMLH